jgi:hypothetical protein
MWSVGGPCVAGAWDKFPLPFGRPCVKKTLLRGTGHKKTKCNSNTEEEIRFRMLLQPYPQQIWMYYPASHRFFHVSTNLNRAYINTNTAVYRELYLHLKYKHSITENL